MALEKVKYEDKVTPIMAKNLNDIQDAVIANQQAVEELQEQTSALASSIVEATVE